MKWSKSFLHTFKEAPSDAEIPSHKLLVRAGLVRKVAPGIYVYGNLGLRAIRKFENIIRQELNARACQEILMPMVQPASLWEETNRWTEMGDGLLKFENRNKHKFCLGATHEEVVTDYVRNDIKSYRDLPITLYQIQTKYRDEIRPRFGLMRGREFIMKDAYSFDADTKGALKNYQIMYDAYKAIFDRVGVSYRIVEADAGNIGGSQTHEFQVLAEAGEDGLMVCNACDFAANVEVAPAISAKSNELIATKKVYYQGERGNIEITLCVQDLANPVKIKNALALSNPPVEMANVPTSEPQLKLVDRSAAPGADGTIDVRMAKAGDLCPRCNGGHYESMRGIEVGHVFYLGTKYSKSMQANFLTSEGQSLPIEMGCYGIGVSRTIQAALEQSHDKDGIIWPIAIAPMQVHISVLDYDNEEVASSAAILCRELESHSVEVLVDDRAERPGVKFKDADLLGLPLRINVGARGLEKGEVELIPRKSREMIKVPLENACEKTIAILKSMGWR